MEMSYRNHGLSGSEDSHVVTRTMGRYCGSSWRAGTSVSQPDIPSYSQCSASNFFILRAIQYAKVQGLRVVAIDGGKQKGDLCTKMGADAVIDFLETKVFQSSSQHPNIVSPMFLSVGYRGRCDKNHQRWCSRSPCREF